MVGMKCKLHTLILPVSKRNLCAAKGYDKWTDRRNVLKYNLLCSSGKKYFSEKCVSMSMEGREAPLGGDVSISYTEIRSFPECALASGERLPNRKPISISTISPTALPFSSFPEISFIFCASSFTQLA